MTVSLCVREPYQVDGDRRFRFGVAAAAAVPGIGALAPVVSADGAAAMGGHIDDTLGDRLTRYLADGVAIDDAVEVLLGAADVSVRRGRQLHGVGRSSSVTATGRDCVAAADRDGDHYTVAGTHLPSEAALDAIADRYTGAAFGEEPLAERLIDSLSAATDSGIDSRRGDADNDGSLTVGSAAVRVVTTESTDNRRFYNDLRVDASESPIADLETTYNAALLGYEQTVDAYAEPDDPQSP
jgi:uncharacterized Ntn-hydrolase superfamily protein